MTTRREFLALGALGLGGCLLEARPPPVVHHPRGPLGRIARPAPPARGTVLVGAGTVDLTPPPGAKVWLAGYGPNRPMKRISDPIGAQCLVVDDGARRVALVMVDVVGLMHPTIERIRKLVGPSIEVVVASTHNHASPDTIGFWGPAVMYAVPYRTGIDPAYLAVAERRIAQLVARTAASVRPARLRVGEAPLHAEGLITNLRPPFVVEQSVMVLEARELDSDAAIATLVNFACHPETMGPRSDALGAGFPGRLRKSLDEATGGVTVFANGALGGMIVPQVDDYDGVEARRNKDHAIADAALAAALEALKSAREIPIDRVRLTLHELEIPASNGLFKFLEDQGVVEARRRGKNGGPMSEVGVLALGPIALALIPGEATQKVGKQIEAKLKARGYEITRVVGLAGDELGYLLDPATEYDDPEFAYEVSVSAGRDVVPALLKALD